MLARMRHTPVLLAALVVACGGGPSEADIEATVEARVEIAKASFTPQVIVKQVIVEKIVVVTATPTPTPTQVPQVPPTPTPTPVPTMPTPTATVTPTSAPTTARRKGKMGEGEAGTQPAAILGLDKIFGQFPCSEDGTIAFN